MGGKLISFVNELFNVPLIENLDLCMLGITSVNLEVHDCSDLWCQSAVGCTNS